MDKKKKNVYIMLVRDNLSISDPDGKSTQSYKEALTA